MRGVPLGVGIIACGAAFGAGWMTGTFSTRHDGPARPVAPEQRLPAPVSMPSGRPSAPERAEPLPGSEAVPPDAPGRYPGTDGPPDSEGGDAGAVLDPGRPVRTQGDVVAAVRAALEQDRDERDRRERALREGPWGEFNYDVNRMAERIGGVSDDQKKQYAALLEWRRETRDALEKRLEAKEIPRPEFEAGLREIADYMTERMRQVLDAEQFRAYQSHYGRWDRGGWGRR